MRSSCTLINYVAVHLLFMCSDPILKCQEPFVRFDPTCTLFKSAIFLRVNDVLARLDTAFSIR